MNRGNDGHDTNDGNDANDGNGRTWALRFVSFAGAAALTVAMVNAQQTPPAPVADPFLWLEDVEGAKAMDWVKAKNAATLAERVATLERIIASS